MTLLTAKYDARRPSKGSYSAIVYIDGSQVVAEDADGRVIASGEAGTDDASIISGLFATAKHIQLSADTFILTSPITGFPNNYPNYVNSGVKITGCGQGTRLVYNGNDCALNIGTGRVSSALTCNFHQIEDLVIDMSGGSGTGAAIKMEAAGRCHISDVGILGNNLNTGIRIASNSYGSWSLMNQFSKLTVYNCLYGMYLGDEGAQALLSNDSQIVECVNGIYSLGSLLYIRDSQLRTAAADHYAIEVDGGINNYDAIYIDNGQIYIHSGHHSFRNCSMVAPKVLASSIVYIAGDCKVSTAAGFWDNQDEMFQYNNFPLYIMAYDQVLDKYGTVVTDSNALGGKARQNIGTTAQEYLMMPSMYSGDWGYLPRGKYNLTIRAKDTNQVADSIQLAVRNITDNTYPLIQYITLTSSYAEYIFPFTIVSADAGDDFQIYIYKYTENSDKISINYVKLDRIGPETSQA